MINIKTKWYIIKTKYIIYEELTATLLLFCYSSVGFCFPNYVKIFQLILSRFLLPNLCENLSVIPQLVFASQPMSKSICKHVLHLHHISLMIYSFKYQYNAEYTVRSSRWELIGNAKISRIQCDDLYFLINVFSSAIAEDLITNAICASVFFQLSAE